MGRHPNHDTPYLVHPVAVKHYRYAAVYRTVPADNAKDKPVRKKVYIGTLDEHLVFHPNNNLRLMDISERRKLIFPETWDLTAFHRLDRTLQSEQTSSDGPDSNAGKTDRDNAGNRTLPVLTHREARQHPLPCKGVFHCTTRSTEIFGSAKKY